MFLNQNKEREIRMNDKNQNPMPNASTPPAGERLVSSKPERTLNRRDFLRIAGVTVAVVAVGAGGFTVVKTLTQDQQEVLKADIAQILTRQYGETKGRMLDQKFQQELETALAQLPYIGTSEENKWADNMPSAAFALAAYRVLVPEYATVEEVGHILYETLQLDMSGLTAFAMRATYNEKAIIEKLKALAARSQKRQYPEDWVLTFVEGNGQDFTYGVDVTECAIQKYLTKQGAPELTRYLCLTDYVVSEAMGRGLVRDKTLAEGCAVCNFRYKQGRPSYLYPLRDGWPPKFVGA
jgi:hypothetical protein